MASINYGAKEISVKIVYYGPGLSGKTTNLQVIHQKIPRENKSNMVSLATETDRTLFFDFLPLDLGKIKGFTTKFQLYTVPGQVYYNATRKLVLRGVDGVVFVVDSQPSKIDENIESFQNLLDNLAEYGYQIQNLPVVLQYNKRDVPDAVPIDQLQAIINKSNYPWTEAVAIKGKGVFDTLKYIGKIVIDELNRKYSRTPGTAASQRPAVSQPRPATPPPPRAAAPAPNVLPQQPRPPLAVAPQQPIYRPMAQTPPIQPRQPMPAPRPAAAVPPSRPAPPRPAVARPAPPPPPPIDPFLDSQESTASPHPPAPAPAAATEESAMPGIDIFSPSARAPRPPEQSRASAPPRQAPQQSFIDYNTVNLSPLGQEEPPSRISPDDTATAFPEPQIPVNKSELDLEIERYQREIEERQQHAMGRATAPHAAAAKPRQEYDQAAPQPYSNPQIDIYQPAAPPHASADEAPSYESTVNSQDYQVYDIAGSAPAGAPPGASEQPVETPMQEPENANDTGQSPMYFTSVNTDRTRRKVKRPVNPRERAGNKGLLSKFFGKKDQDE